MRFQLVSIVTCLSAVAAFTNPIKVGSDPHMIFHNGLYYLTSTTWNDIQITASSTIEGLKTAEPRSIWNNTSGPTLQCNFWAPEMHLVQGRWHVYFSSTICEGGWDDMRPTLTVYALAGGLDDPISGDYHMAGAVKPPNFQDGMLDATVFKHDNRTYFLYSSAQGDQSPNGSSLWISEMLAATVVTNATMIAEPDMPWEMSVGPVLEGPYGVVSPAGTVYMVYSADSCGTPAYKLGALRLSKGAELTERASWSKLPEPIFQSANGLYGTGHNAFFKSPDGSQDWQVFHANQNASDGCGPTRETFIQPVSWKCDAPYLGTPLSAGTEIVPPSGEAKAA